MKWILLILVVIGVAYLLLAKPDLSFILKPAASINGKVQIKAENDGVRIQDINYFQTAAYLYCKNQFKCPSSLRDLQKKAYIQDYKIDPDSQADYSYTLNSNGHDCVISATLSTGKLYSKNCIQ